MAHKHIRVFVVSMAQAITKAAESRPALVRVETRWQLAPAASALLFFL